MVECERCHRKFGSYAALSQHFDTKHQNAQRPHELERELAVEKELDTYKATVHYAYGPSKTKLAVFLLILIVAAGVIGYVAFTPREAGGSILGVGSTAPNFTLQDVAGGTFTLSDYQGKSNVLLLFNEGLSCQPCLQQMHDLDGLNAQFRGMNVLVVSVTPDNVGQLRGWMGAGGPQYGKVLSDPGLVAFSLYHPVGTGGSMMTHTFVLINRAGMVIWRQDYGPGSMYVQNTDIFAAVTKALGT
ncbi:MAG: redoxin domain-containing protein [Candidatus Bathyarchaeia archaeon]